MNMVDTNSGGRPMNSEAGPALLQAARELVAEYGYEKVSMQMIADHAGVGRQTAYRRWPSKAELVLEAFVAKADRLSAVEQGPVVEMLERFLQQIFHGLEKDGLAVRSLIASAQGDPAFRETFYERFIKPRDQVLARILKQGVDQGELPASMDLDRMVEMIHGAFWYRLLLGRDLDERYAKQLAAMALGYHSGAR